MSALGTRLTKAIRVRSDAVRHVYTAARRAGRYWRDGERRAALRKLAQTPLSIGRDQDSPWSNRRNSPRLPAS